MYKLPYSIQYSRVSFDFAYQTAILVRNMSSSDLTETKPPLVCSMEVLVDYLRLSSDVNMSIILGTESFATYGDKLHLTDS